MRRRTFITLLGGATAWPLTTRAQQTTRPRRIGVLMPTVADDPEGQARIAAFLQGLQQEGWSVGDNLRVHIRWAGSNPDRIRGNAAELLAMMPEVVFTNTTAAVGPLLQASRTVPIVFAVVADPIGAGYVGSLSRPGGNATGFSTYEYGMSGKWLELLKQVAPSTSHAIVIRDAASPSGVGHWGAVQTAAPMLGVEVSPVTIGDAIDIERTLANFGQSPQRGLIVTPSPLAVAHRDLLISLAARHNLPAVYPAGFFIHAGGLISYGPDLLDQHRRAAGYVGRILNGEKAADLPVQAPTKYELVINLKTAKALGLEIPPTLLARADEVIE